MAYTSLSPARAALYRRTPTVGLGNPLLEVGILVAQAALIAGFIYSAWLVFKGATGGYCAAAPTSPECNTPEMKRFLEGKYALTADGVISSQNLANAASLWRKSGLAIPEIPSSLASADFSFSVEDFSSTLASAMEYAPSALTPEMADVVATLIAPDATPPSTIDPATVTVTVDPTTGIVEASSGPTPTQLAVGALVVLGLGYAAYKYP